MKKVLSIFVVFSVLFIVACEIDLSKDAQDLLVNNAGFAIGIAAAKLPPEVNLILVDFYSLAVNGKLDPDATNNLINSFIETDDLVLKALANRLVKLAEYLGATVIQGKITDLGDLSPELMEQLATGYIEGFNLAKIK